MNDLIEPKARPMRRRWRRMAAAVCVSATAAAYAGASGCSTLAYPQSPQYGEDGFQNERKPQPLGWRQTSKLWWDFLVGGKPKGTVPAHAIQVQPLSPGQLAQAPDGTVYRLGHSTVLLKLQGRFWLTDPVFAERASPVQWAGPKRFHAPPLSLDDLPHLSAVVLSHDHYDHLDRETVIALAAKTDVFLTPLGVGDRLVRWGVPRERIRQLDWWEHTDVDGVQFTATPSQHFSGRTLFDRNKTLWASWVIQADDAKVFFSGDTGYFDGFRTIGDRFGPFDLTLLECGAYDRRWQDVHMLPAQTLQAHLDLRGRWLVPIHNSTFDLAFHGWSEPMETLYSLSQGAGVDIATPVIGAPLAIRQPEGTQPWWRAE
ncbi:L-ascorbate metabolism protein UlaG, beta-lactamase superfamily [Pseudoxanthomonas sp. CF385]|uniref:MBL fold metallo-hydrolase n=1 Tax=Pseudoxanthomonas sp. CF385 TaxID=1881042 RepID=UPI00088EA367|nr:MBL fold metallo-hydrolase [Pseudoxanthomonas sp. CF385]SDQ87028.1 L-ascorbate metabolism protein UlaG, beta-lactamase superfamily [Pseudoxanthomonas sp. CF385]